MAEKNTVQGYVKKVDDFEELRRSLERSRQTNQIKQETQNYSPSQQQVEREKNSIPMYSRDRRDSPDCINCSFPWTVTQQGEQALTYEIPILTTKKFRAELNREYIQMIVDRLLCVWNALNKTDEREIGRFRILR